MSGAGQVSRSYDNLLGGKQQSHFTNKEARPERLSNFPKVSQLACGRCVFRCPKSVLFLLCHAVLMDCGSRGGRRMLF